MRALLLVVIAALFMAQAATADMVTNAGLDVHYSISGKGSPVVAGRRVRALTRTI